MAADHSRPQLDGGLEKVSLASGTKLGRYEIRSQLGAGGMGEVYLAFDTELDRIVAIKILPEALASNQQRLQRFIQEAKAASALNHPHILTIHEIGTTETSRFIATEFIDGDTLRRRIRDGSLSLNEILDVPCKLPARWLRHMRPASSIATLNPRTSWSGATAI